MPYSRFEGCSTNFILGSYHCRALSKTRGIAIETWLNSLDGTAQGLLASRYRGFK